MPRARRLRAGLVTAPIDVPAGVTLSARGITITIDLSARTGQRRRRRRRWSNLELLELERGPLHIIRVRSW